MSPRLRALCFLLASATGRAGRIARRTQVLGTAVDRFPADVYEAGPSSVGTVLFVHGMTRHGHRDPRQVAACRALARTGLRVVAPCFEEIAAPRVEVGSLARLGRAIEAVAADPGLAPGGRIALFGASFSASLCLLAATRAEIARHVGVICALGPYADLHACLSHVMGGAPVEGGRAGGRDVDRYGRMVIFRSLLHRVLGPIPQVESALAVALADDSLRRARPLLPSTLARLDPEAREIVGRVLADPAWCRAMAPRVLAASADLVVELDLLPRADQVGCPVVLLHGRDDDVIPASESRALYARLVSAGVPCRLEVTPLLSHGDQQWGPRSAGPALRLVDALAWYLARVPGSAA